MNQLLQSGKYQLLDSKNKLFNLNIKFRKGITTFKCQDIQFNNPELEKCIHILPHDQNTGGFFIAVLKRK